MTEELKPEHPKTSDWPAGTAPAVSEGKGNNIDEVVRVELKEVTYTCPKRGEVTEKVEVKIYGTGGKPVVQVCR